MFAGGTVRRFRGHWFSHCARNDCSGSGSSASTSTSPIFAASSRLRDHPFTLRRPMRTSEPPRFDVGELGVMRRRPLDQQVAVAVLQPGQRNLAALEHQLSRQPMGGRSRAAIEAATRSTIVGVRPSSIDDDFTFHASSAAAQLTE